MFIGLMADQHLALTPEMSAYYREVGVREPYILRQLREETSALPNAGMQISPELGQYIRLLSSMQGFRRAIEIGVFTGYSALNLALALPDDGRIIACDINEEWTSTARRYWHAAGVDHKISLRLGPAITTLENLIPIGRSAYDFVFIDADKETYDTYYEHALTLLRPGGIIALDNIFRGGRIANPAETGEDIQVLRALNQKIQTDPRIDFAIIPIGDGLTTVRKRG